MKLLLGLAGFILASCPVMAQTGNQSSTPATPAASQPAVAYVPTPEEKELIQLSQEWMDAALRRKDEKRLRELMAPEYTLQIWDASRAPQPLEAWLHTLKNRLDKIEFEFSGLNVRVFGDVAVVYSRFWWKGTMDGKAFVDSGFLADVWVKKGGKWQVVARRSAPQQQIQDVLKPVAFSALGADSGSQVEQNKIVVRRLAEALQQGDLRTLNDLGDPKALEHTSKGTREHGPPFSDLKDACPMCVVLSPRQLTIEFMIAEGDLVAVRATARGTQSGPLGDIPASGKEITVSYNNVYRIRGGRIVELWVGMDRLSMMEQLGMKLCPQDAPK